MYIIVSVCGTDLAGLSERVVAIETRLGSRVTNGTAKDEDEEDFDLFGSDEVCRLMSYVERS